MSSILIFLLISVALPIVALLSVVGLLYWRLSGISADMRLHKLAPDVYVYRGFFSNSAVLVLPKSVVVIDTQTNPAVAERLKQQICLVTDNPVRHVINTHYHGDHAGGNTAFPEAEIIASEDTARYVVERDQERVEYCHTFGLHLQEVPPVRVPDRTFAGSMRLEIDGEVLEVAQIGRSRPWSGGPPGGSPSWEMGWPQTSIPGSACPSSMRAFRTTATGSVTSKPSVTGSCGASRKGRRLRNDGGGRDDRVVRGAHGAGGRSFAR